MKLFRNSTTTLVLLLSLVALAAPAQARPVFGVADQNPKVFQDSRFQALHTTISRLVVSYNVALLHNYESDRVDAWLAAAKAAKIEPMLAFNAVPGCYLPHRHNLIPHTKRCQLPSVATFRRAFAAFHARWPEVNIFTAWNEANHRAQPTTHEPRRAAEYYNVISTECRRCTNVAGDVLDQNGFTSWLATYKHYLRIKPTIWGLHNYDDVNNHRSSGTRAMLAATSGQLWITETGGLVRFARRPFSLARGASQTAFMLRLAMLSPRIRRVYVYQWSAGTPRFDSGLTSANGKLRPSYRVLRKALGAQAHQPARPAK